MRPFRGKFWFILAIGIAAGILFSSRGQVAYAAQKTPVGSTANILGIQSDAQTSYPGISWLRLSYTTCGNSNLSGQVLKDTIKNYHKQDINILLVVCQPDLSIILDPTYLKDAAQGRADAVQCGNEQMKNDPGHTRYVPPDLYAQFFNLCETTMHNVRPNIPVLLGSLDPHIVGPDNALLAYQVSYLNSVETAMNTIVNPGGNWSWRAQVIGLIDSWHNGYPSSSDNNLYQLFVFWAQQFQIDINSSDFGKHLWVVEGTGCFTGCGLNGTYQVSVSHVLTLITDVLTTLQYSVPFFYFTGKDFVLYGFLWPIGVLDVNGNPKPLRQDLPMGARVLNMTCMIDNSQQTVQVADQELLLAKLYAGCKLPSDYVSILES